MLTTCGHQTIEKTTEGVNSRIKAGPVISTINDSFGQLKKKPPFAGDGYYFWEDNIEAGEWWGKVHYANKGKEFRIFGINFLLRYDDDSFLDLVGNRQHLRLIQKIIVKLKKSMKCDDWKLHQFIMFLRKKNHEGKIKFPYKIMRFNDQNLDIAN